MEKDYLRISSTVLVSLLFGLALVLVNSWFNQPGVEEVVPRSTYLMVMIALFFIDTVAFIFMQLYFIYDRRQFSNCVLSLVLNFFIGLSFCFASFFCFAIYVTLIVSI